MEFTDKQLFQSQFCELRLAPTGKINLVHNWDKKFSAYRWCRLMKYRDIAFLLFTDIIKKNYKIWSYLYYLSYI